MSFWALIHESINLGVQLIHSAILRQRLLHHEVIHLGLHILHSAIMCLRLIHKEVIHFIHLGLQLLDSAIQLNNMFCCCHRSRNCSWNNLLSRWSRRWSRWSRTPPLMHWRRMPWSLGRGGIRWRRSRPRWSLDRGGIRWRRCFRRRWGIRWRRCFSRRWSLGRGGSNSRMALPKWCIPWILHWCIRVWHRVIGATLARLGRTATAKATCANLMLILQSSGPDNILAH